MNTIINKNITQNFSEARKLEWLETNGLGGWASSTITGANSRRYHGLLVAATHPPVGRVVLLSKLDETIFVDDKRYGLSSNQYPNAVYPEGYKSLQRFERNIFPEFYYEADGIEIKKAVAAINNENTVVIIYEVVKAGKEITIELLPLFAGRDYHGISHKNDFINQHAEFSDGILRYKPYNDLPDVYISATSSVYQSDPLWFYNFEYEIEKYRGLDYREDLFSPGKLRVNLKEGEKFGVIVSTENPSNKNAFALFNTEEQRRKNIISKSDDELIQTLLLTADQFVVNRGEDLKTIIAGYHWFSDWGRDTMIALPGICLSTGRDEDAKKILKAFAETVSEGMLPNRFPDYNEPLEYNTVDATLWFFVAIYKYYLLTNDSGFVKTELLSVLKNIIDWHYKGTRYNIKAAGDELLSFGQDGFQLTWMDAKIGDWVVTPRSGKAVEINALWFNALKIYSYFSNLFGDTNTAKIIDLKAEKVRENFNKTFWNHDAGYLYDVINGDYFDSTLRPNQLFALSLPFKLVDDERALSIISIIENKLYTPVGLRSLSPDHKDYKPIYGGDQYSRDSSYHQGTVWSWLLGPYIDALIRYEDADGKKKAGKIIEYFKYHLDEAGIGTISEIYDAELPNSPRGCIAQAWSVGEILRVCLDYGLTRKTESKKVYSNNDLELVQNK